MDFNLENIEDIIKFNYKSSDGGNEKKVWNILKNKDIKLLIDDYDKN